MTASQQFCTFFVDGACYGVDVVHVQEVLRYQRITRVPLAPPVVRGLINLRGQIVTALELRRLLGLPARPADRCPMNVVIRTGADAVSLLVDDVGDVLTLDESAFERPPETVRGVARELLRGVYKLPGTLLQILDPERVVALSATRKD